MVAPHPPTSREHVHGLFVSPFSPPSNKIPLKSGKLRLPNYAAPPVRPTPPASTIPPRLPTPPSSSDPAERPTLQVDVSQPHGYESPSPASSTLSTPSVSPNMAPRVLINGHPANYACPPHTQAHIDDWDWMAPPALNTFAKQPSTRRSASDSGVPGLSGSDYGVSGLPSAARSQSSNGVPRLPPGSDNLSGDTLYNAFVTRWCFAQGPAAHGPLMGGDGGILA